MIDCRFKPIEKWPSNPTPKENRRHRFRARGAKPNQRIEGANMTEHTPR